MREVDLPPCGCADPGRADASTCYCGVEDILRVIRRRYSLAVMNAIHMNGSARYNDLERALPDISSSTLAETLSVLDTAGLVLRDVTGQEHARPSYTLTSSGAKLLSRLRPLLMDVKQDR